MKPDKELEQLTAEENKLVAQQKKERGLIRKKISRAKKRINAEAEKLEARRIVVMGSYLAKKIDADPDAKSNLMRELSSCLDLQRDRELFGLPRKQKSKADGS